MVVAIMVAEPALEAGAWKHRDMIVGLIGGLSFLVSSIAFWPLKLREINALISHENPYRGSSNA
jgi:hypothetical protein